MKQLLERTHRKLGLRVELVAITSDGDRDQQSVLKDWGGVGVFVKELEHALTDKRIDLAVHSLKDLPIKQPRGLMWAAVPVREDVRDVAVTRSGKRLRDLPMGAVIGTGSPRRRVQLQSTYTHLSFAEIRGHVETRLRKVRDGAVDGTLLARAGLKRLGLLKKIKTETLPLEILLPAPGQGALAVECRSRDKLTRRLLAAIQDPKLTACVECERACLAALGGGCQLPLGAYADFHGNHKHLRLRAVLASSNGCLTRFEGSGPKNNPRALGRRGAKWLSATKNTQAQRDS